MKDVERTPGKLNETSAEFSPRQLTIFIGHWFSVCGNCGNNADYTEKSHVMELMEGPGCGIKWKYVSSDNGDLLVAALRPDLEWRDPDPEIDGITNAMEDKMLRGLNVIGPIDPSEIAEEQHSY